MVVKAILAGFVLLALLLGGLLALGRARADAQTRELRARLEQARVEIRPAHVDLNALQGAGELPAPVRRYFHAVLVDGQPMIAAATLRHSGTFDMGEGAHKWVPFASDQRVITRRPGFDWAASLPMFAGLRVRVHDAYVAGEGVLHASLFGLVTVAGLRGTPQAAAGELMRFLAEAPWYPTALLPGQGVGWEPIDDRSALATLTDGVTRVAVTFRFDEEGLVTGIHAEARDRTVGTTTVPTPWSGRFWAYERRAGMRVPTQGEVGWHVADGWRPYWRGRSDEITYEFAGRRGVEPGAEPASVK